MSACCSADATYSTRSFPCHKQITDEVETHAYVLVSSKAQGLLNQRLNPLIVLKDFNACPTRLGRNERPNVAHKQSFLDPVPNCNVICSEVDNDTTCCVLLARLTAVPSKVPAIQDTERLPLTVSS